MMFYEGFDFLARFKILRRQPSAVKTRSWMISWKDLRSDGGVSVVFFLKNFMLSSPSGC